MDPAFQGELALKESRPQEALDFFTTALKASPASPNYYIKRSIAHHRLKDYAAALADSEYAIVAAQKRGKRELIGEGQLRRGISLLQMRRISDARLCFAWAGKYGAHKNQCSIWTEKVKREVKSLPEGDERLRISNIEELPKVALPDPSKTSTSSQPRRTADPATPSAPTVPTNPADKKDTGIGKASNAQPSVGSSTPAKNIRHEWYQNSDNVYLSLFAKNVPKEKSSVEIQPNSVNVSFPLDNGSTYDFSIDPTYAEIKHGDASFRILSTKMELTLPKAAPGMKWSALEGDANASTTNTSQIQAPSRLAPSATVASPYATKGGQKKDWDKIASSYQKPPNAGKENDEGTKDENHGKVMIGEEDEMGGDPADFFFKKLYKGASDETKRAMMKSYQESGGTALSTNWADVSKSTVPVTPPEGMEAKKWSS